MQGAEYQVFLSFRGPDTRQAFTDCLYHFLIDAGVRVFRDNEEIRPGDKIEEILKAIENSIVCIPIFSKDYASSKWCLLELAKMVELKKKIVPIFYDVTPNDVKSKTGLYHKTLAKHKEEKEKKQWEKALEEVVEISGWESLEAMQDNAFEEVVKIKGWELINTGHGELCKSIVKEVLVNLKVKDRIVTDDLVGMEKLVELALEHLDIKAPGVRYLGIHGMGGTGKTTLAKIVFNRISASFEACPFLADVRESSRHGLKDLQKKLICDLRGKQSSDISDIDHGIKVLRDICQSRKTLIVLDDVDRQEEIECLAGSSNWFYSGSRIIVTTRDVRVLPKQEKYEQGHEEFKSKELWTLEMKEMDPEQALQLFSRHAFKKDYPPADYLDVSKEVVSAIGHLPLALEIIGSHLCGKHREAWEDGRSTLVKIPQKNIQKTLMLSCDALDYRTKQIFLDIACLPINLSKINAFCMWRSCDFRPEIGVEELISLSLVKIVNDDIIWMHDYLRDLGRDIICMENFADSRERSRLWDPEEAFNIMKRKEGTGKIEVLHLPTDFTLRHCVLTPDHFRNLRNLRFVYSFGLNIVGDFEHHFSQLRWLSWWSCPRDFTAKNLNLEKLVILDLGDSEITEDWEGWNQIKVGDSLEVLDLSHCRLLRKMRNLSRYKNLERLILKGCSSLSEIDSSIGKLKSLKHLNLKGCRSLQGLPTEIGSLRALEEIFLESCEEFTSLPESIVNLKSLVILEVADVNIIGLPDTIGRLKKLKRLSLRNCWIQRLPETLGGLHSLIVLDLSGTKITELPNSLRGLKKLERLSLGRCHGIRNLPGSIGDLESLSELDISHSGLIELPDSVGDPKKLKVINMAFCNIRELPRSVGKMKKLEELELSCTKIFMLPSTISQLSSLKTLHLTNCDELEELPMLPTSLVSLKFNSIKLKRLPDLSVLSNLAHLVLNNVEERRPPSLDEALFQMRADENLLEFKKSLQFNISNTSTIPEGILGFFPQLESLELGCPELLNSPQFPLSLSNLVLKYLKMDAKLTCLSELNNLSKLRLFKCSIGEDGFTSLEIGNLKHLRSLCFEEDCSGLNGLSLPGSLQFLDLLRCKYVGKLPDFSHLQNLQELRIKLCIQLSEVPSLGGLKSLRWLSIYDCTSWKGAGLQLPESLKVLQIYSCPFLEELPIMSHLRNLQVLQIEFCKLLLAIQGVGGLVSLEELYISNCKSLQLCGHSMPANLKRLLVQSSTCLSKSPDLSCLKELQKLDIYRCDEVVKISGLQVMESLQELSIKSCNSLKKLGRQLPVSLATLQVSSCAYLKRLPDVSRLRSLQKLNFDSHAEVPGLEELKWLKGKFDDLDNTWQYVAE